MLIGAIGGIEAIGSVTASGAVGARIYFALELGSNLIGSIRAIRAIRAIGAIGEIGSVRDIGVIGAGIYFAPASCQCLFDHVWVQGVGFSKTLRVLLRPQEWICQDRAISCELLPMNAKPETAPQIVIRGKGSVKAGRGGSFRGEVIGEDEVCPPLPSVC